MLYGIVDVHFFFSFFFSATILSGPYLWNRYSQRLQIQCAAWSLRSSFCTIAYHPIRFVIIFFYIIFFFSPRFCPGHISENRYSQKLQIECAAWFCGLVFALLLTIQFTLLFFIFFFIFPFFPARILSGPYLWNRYSQRLPN